jgi:pilus assembly protein CpaC
MQVLSIKRIALACWVSTLAIHGPLWAVETIQLMQLAAGKSTVITLPANAVRLAVGNPEVADVMLINPREVYVLGKKSGNTNLTMWTKGGTTSVMDLSVSVDLQSLRNSMRELVPLEKNVRVDALGDTLVVSGSVSDPIRLQRLISLSEVFNNGKKVINLLQLTGSQQVMLEVKVAEVSKTLLDKLGFEFSGTRTNGGATYGLLSSLLTTGAGTASAGNSSTSIKLDAEIKKGLVKILAEPTITAISGQEGSFLAGGKIFIPVPQSSSGGATTIVLEEREFGVGLKFTPTVLGDGLINLRVTPEVSELSQAGTAVTTSTGQVSVLPSITTRRASTTVQLRDGESFAIGGLIKNNVTEAVKAFPILGELPVLGVLFRSSAFQAERTELVFVVTPRLAKASTKNLPLPTDNFIEPTRGELHWQGRLEGEVKPSTEQPRK